MSLLKRNGILIGLMILMSCTTQMYKYKKAEGYKPQTTLLAEQHIKTLNERDPIKRNSLFHEVYYKEFSFVDLIVRYDEIHAKYPTSFFSLNGPVDTKQNIVRVKWKLGKPGMPAHTTGEDILFLIQEKIKSHYVFIDSHEEGILSLRKKEFRPEAPRIL